MGKPLDAAVAVLERIAAGTVEDGGAILRFAAGDAATVQEEAAAALKALKPQRPAPQARSKPDEPVGAGRYDPARLPEGAAGLKLFRYAKGDRLIACEGVMFPGGRAAVDTILRRAQISGRVEINGTIENHFADIHDKDGSMIQTVALDAASYKSLKTRWMPCRTERSS